MGGNTSVALFWVIVVIVFSFLVILFINMYTAHSQKYRERGLSRAERKQAKDLAGGDAQVKVVERNKVVIALDEVFDVNDVCHEAALPLIAARYDCIIAGAAGAHQ